MEMRCGASRADIVRMKGNPNVASGFTIPFNVSEELIGHSNWIYELKHDGFRGILYVDRDQAWLVSRKGKKFRQFNTASRLISAFWKQASLWPE